MTLALTVLGPAEAVGFASMTFPAYRHLLSLEPAPTLLGEPASRPVQPLALGGWIDGQRAAFALAGLPVDEAGDPELLSLYVAPSFRSQGVGRATLAALEGELAGRGFTLVTTVFTANAPGSAAFARVLAARQWSPPQPRTLLMRFTLPEAERFPWFDRYPVREGCTIFPWRELTAQERQQLIDSQRQRHWIAEDLVPWRWDEPVFEPITSVGMRSPEGVVGWVINHALDDTTLRFTCSYIRKDYGRRGRILPLYSASIKRMRETSFTSCSFIAPLHHATMAAFVRRWMAPWAGTVRETLGSAKQLSVGADVVTKGVEHSLLAATTGDPRTDESTKK